MDAEVEAFEKTILAHADSYQKKRAASFSSLASASTHRSSVSSASSVESSRRSSMHEQGFSNGFSFSKIDNISEEVQSAIDDAWEAEEDAIDMSVRILPGVRRVIDALPEDKYAVATSGAKTYCHGCLERVGIVPPKVCITADDKRL